MHKPSLQSRAGFALATLALALSSAHAANLFSQPDENFSGRVFVSSGAALPGQEATVSGMGFKPGQQINLRKDGTLLLEKPIVADEKGAFQAKLTVPADAVPATHAVVLEAVNPPAASIVNFKVSPDVPLSGADKFSIHSQKLTNGLYQSAYSNKSDRLFVTAAVGRPPVKSSELLKVNPSTLAIEARVTPPVDESRNDGHLVAVYGVAVDDKHGNVWVTNTRQGTVTVYKQADLALVKQLEKNSAVHARDVVIDESLNKAFVSTPGTAQVVVFDTAKNAPHGTIELKSKQRGGTISPMSLAVDPAGHKVYVVGASTNEIFVIDGKTDSVEKVLPIEGLRGGSGIAVDAAKQRIFLAAQGSDVVIVADLNDGKVLARTPVGAGALNVQFDPVNRLAYSSNRAAGTFTVLDENGKIIANLEGGSLPNHVSVDGKGNAYAINKARGADDATGDRITRLTPKK